MSQKHIIKRHLHIVNILKQKPSTFEEVTALLINKSIFDEEDYSITQRTFQRDIKDIASIYDIEITYNKKEQVYEIENIFQNPLSERLFDTINLLDTIKLAGQYSDSIIFENRKFTGINFIPILLKAIENNKEIEFIHKKYWDNESLKRIVKPYLIKESKNRWYLIGLEKQSNSIKTFGLDRILSLEILNNSFKKPSSKKIKEMFKHSFGVIFENKPPEKIVLEFSSFQANYIKSLPLHSSQKIISEDDSRCLIELYIYPTYDFIIELLSLGDEVKVLEPKSLVDEVKQSLRNTLDNYYS